jgi:hypothetical protein
MKFHVAKTTVVINSKGGSFNVTRGSSKTSIKLDSLIEYKNAGKEEVVKHSLENVNFVISEERKYVALLMTGTPDSRYKKYCKAVMSTESISSPSGKDFVGNEDLISPYSACGSVVSFSGKLDNGSKVTIDVMVVDSMGKVGTKEQSWWASSGDVKFNVELDNWHWSDEESDNSLDLGICIKCGEKWVQDEATNKFTYMIGKDAQLNLANKYYTKDVSKPWQLEGLSDDYPQLDQQSSIFTVQFGKLNGKLFYDPAIIYDKFPGKY